MWLADHPTDELDSEQLLRDVASKAQSRNPTREDGERLKFLEDLREKRKSLAASPGRESRMEDFKTKALPAPTCSTKVSI